MKSEHSKRYVGKLIRYFGATPMTEMDQAAIDDAANVLYPRNEAIISRADHGHRGVPLLSRWTLRSPILA